MLSASLLAALLVLLALAGGPGARRAAFGPLPAAIDGQRVKAASSPSPVFAPAAAAILGLSTGEPSLAPGPSSPDDTSPAQREGAPKGGSGGGGDRGDDPTEEPEPEPEPPGEGPDEEPRPEPDEDAGKPNGGPKPKPHAKPHPKPHPAPGPGADEGDGSGKGNGPGNGKGQGKPRGEGNGHEGPGSKGKGPKAR